MVDHKPPSALASTPVHPSIPSLAPDKGCLCYVLRTGFSTTQGQLLRMMAFNSSEPPANTKDTYVFIGLLLLFAVYTASTVVAEGLADPHRNRFKLMLHTIIIVTSVVPPELPMELALAVTNSLKQLMSIAVFCTEPFRVPLAGKVDVCCFDKTGTLTSDEMILRGVIIPAPVNGNASLSGLLSATDPAIPPATTYILAACNSLATTGSSDELIGDPLEKAVMTAAKWTTKVRRGHERSEWGEKWF